jgi:hypothetical protein
MPDKGAEFHSKVGATQSRIPFNHDDRMVVMKMIYGKCNIQPNINYSPW